MSPRPLCLVTGASGYIGGRLVPELLAAGYPVRCMARDPAKLGDRPWSGDIEVAKADVMDAAAVRRALDGVGVAYYLIHSLGTGSSFEERDRDSARIFADAARDAGVSRIIYLGGIISGQHGQLSPHLRSRGEVGDILLGSGVPTAALQAAVIIGSGSASFEMLRYLTERLPAMVTPMWVDTRIQPIAVRDVLRYLVGAASLPPGVSRRFDIGGPDVLTYADMMRRYAAVAGAAAARPDPRPGAHAAAVVALGRPGDAGTQRPGQAAGRVAAERGRGVRARHRGLHPGSAGRPAAPGRRHRAGLAAHPRRRRLHQLDVRGHARRAQRPAAERSVVAGGSLYVDERTSVVHAPPGALWRMIEGIGGTSGWYSFRAAWAARGLLDRLSAASGCGAGGVTRGTCGSGTRWTSGVSRRSRPGNCSGCARR